MEKKKLVISVLRTGIFQFLNRKPGYSRIIILSPFVRVFMQGYNLENVVKFYGKNAREYALMTGYLSGTSHFFLSHSLFIS